MIILMIITGVLLAVGVASWVMRLSHAVTYGALCAANILSGVGCLLSGGPSAWWAVGNFPAAAGFAYAWWGATRKTAS